MSSSTETRRLVRRTDDRIIAGVASGLASYLGVDPVLVRVGFVLAAVMGGFGILAYAVLWLLAPEGMPDQPTMAGQRRDAGFWVAIGLFLLGALAIANSLGKANLLGPLILIAAGVALWRRQPTGDSTDRQPGPPSGTPSNRPSEIRSPVMSTLTTPPPPADAPPTPPTWTPPAAPQGPVPPGRTRRQPSRLGGMTVAIALLTTGTLYALDRADAIDLAGYVAAGVALAILAAGLLVGTWFGRARWLVWPALILTPMLFAAAVAGSVNLHLGDGIGERSYNVASASDLASSYALGIGDMTLDLRELDLAGAAAETTVHVGLGAVTVYVPRDVTMKVDYDVRAGDVEVLDRVDRGPRATGELTDAGDSAAGTLTLHIEVGVGQIVVERR